MYCTFVAEIPEIVSVVHRDLDRGWGNGDEESDNGLGKVSTVSGDGKNEKTSALTLKVVKKRQQLAMGMWVVDVVVGLCLGDEGEAAAWVPCIYVRTVSGYCWWQRFGGMTLRISEKFEMWLLMVNCQGYSGDDLDVVNRIHLPVDAEGVGVGLPELECSRGRRRSLAFGVHEPLSMAFR